MKLLSTTRLTLSQKHFLDEFMEKDLEHVLEEVGKGEEEAVSIGTQG